eukprot:gene9399-10387_t
MEELSKSLNEFRQSAQFCDVKIISQNGEHCAHRVILAASSNFFKIMFQRCFVESYSGVVKIEDADSEIMEEILSFIYTLDIHLNDGNIMELYRLADRLEINKLMEMCSGFLLNNISIMSCLDVYRVGCTYMNTRLQDTSFNYLVANFQDFLATEEFHDLTKEELIEIIKQDELNIVKEEDLYDAILSWADKDASNRDDLLPEILKFIRFPTMDFDFLEIKVLANPKIADENWNKLIYDVYQRCCRYFKHNEKDALFLMPADLPCYSRKYRIPAQFIYVYGGWTKGRTLDITECYNHKSDQWTVSQNFRDPAGGKCYFGLAQINQLIYFAGGYDGQSYLKSVRKYEPISKNWSEITSMNVPRCFTSLVNLKDKLYAVAGFDGSRRLASVEEYCPKSDQWKLVCPLSTSRSDCAAVATSERIYAIGGYSGDSLRSVEVYDLKRDSWSYTTPLNTRRSGAGAVLLPDGRIFVIGGYDGTCRLKTTEFYDAHNDTWLNGPSMFVARSNFAVSIIGNYVYVIGGYTGQNTINHVERYDIAANSWTMVAKMHCSRSAIKAAVLTNLTNVKDYLWVGLSNNIQDHLNRIYSKDLNIKKEHA